VKVLENKPETIVAAAVLYLGVVYSLPPPARHHTIMHDIWDKFHGVGEVPVIPAGAQGFLTSTGRFVNRRRALRIVKAAGQPQIDHPALNVGGRLYSEDLW